MDAPDLNSKRPLVASDEPAFRSAYFERMVDEKKRTIELSFSSDVEVERWRGMVEVLDHSPESVDLSRLRNGAPLLYNHDLDEVIGVVESARIDADRKGRAVVRFGNSGRAQEIWDDVKDGILRNVSVGYRIKEVTLAEERDDGTDVYRVMNWQPYEVSIVSVPADSTVGVNRSLTSEKITIMETTPETIPAAPAAAPAAPRVDVIAERSAGANTERERVSTILKVGRDYSAPELAQRAVEEGKSIDEFRGMLLEEVDKRNRSIADGTKPIGLSEKEARGFSFIKLVRALAAEPEQRRKFADDAKFELEACRAAADQMTHRSARGTVIPSDVLLQPLIGQRSSTITGAKTASGYTNAGTNSIETLLLTNSFIDLLRNRSVVMGRITELSGLVGNIDIPKQATGPAAQWIGEDEAADATGITFGIVSLRPRTLSARGELTRRLLMQNSLGVEALFRSDLATVMALEIDRSALYGSNANNQPKGLASYSLAGGAWATANKPTFEELVGLETAIAEANADVSSMAYIGTPGFRGHAKTTQKFSGGGDTGTLWEPGNSVNGYPVYISNQVAAGNVFFGNWADLLMGMWGGLDLIVDPYTHSDKGRIRITQFQDVDFTVRREESFAMGMNPVAGGGS
jgi:HK97 family phage major capsid protein/HK97 family phage prohead protease